MVRQDRPSIAASLDTRAIHTTDQTALLRSCCAAQITYKRPGHSTARRESAPALTKLKGESKIDLFVLAGTKSQILSDKTLTALIRRMKSDEEKHIWTDAVVQRSLKHDLIHEKFRPSGVGICPIPVHSRRMKCQ